MNFVREEENGVDGLLDDRDPLHSNTWSISGELTEDGLPIFAYDPHLDPLLPSNWFLNEISWDDHSVIGATTVGFPLISSGQSLNLSWGVTTAYVDGSDAWEEEVN